MRLVAKYLRQALHFSCLAERENNLRLRRRFEKQVDVYRKLAQARAKQLGISLPSRAVVEVPGSPTDDENDAGHATRLPFEAA